MALKTIFTFYDKMRHTLLTSVLWCMIISTKRHSCVGSMIKPYFHHHFLKDHPITKVLFRYSRFHKTLPRSSLQIHWISVRFYEMGDSKTEMQFYRNQFHCHWIIKKIQPPWYKLIFHPKSFKNAIRITCTYMYFLR